MARIRSIKPEFWTDEKVVELSAFARLLFIGIWNFCDDEGRMTYSPKRMKMQIFPSDDVDCAALTLEIEAQGMIHIYSVDGIECLQVKQFDKHQKIDKRSASKLPKAPTCDDSPQTPPNPADGREGKGREGIVDMSGDAEFPAAPPAPKAQGAIQESALILDYLNQKTGHSYKPVDANLKLIAACLKTGSLNECLAVIDNRVKAWGGDPKMQDFLRPGTLFNASKFAQYAGQLGVSAKPVLKDWQ